MYCVYGKSEWRHAGRVEAVHLLGRGSVGSWLPASCTSSGQASRLTLYGTVPDSQASRSLCLTLARDGQRSL